MNVVSGNRFVLWVVVFLAGLAAAVASASDQLVFYSGGRARALVKSPTEFVVTLPPGAAQATRARLGADPECSVEPIPWAPHKTDHYIVRVPKVDAAARARVLNIPGVEGVQAVFRFQGSQSPMLSTGNAVVRLSGSLTRFEREQFFRDFRVEVVRAVDAENNVYVVRPLGHPQDGDVRTAMAMYRDDRTLFAHPDFILAAAPKQVLVQVEDEFFQKQWHLNNTGQELGTPGADINVAGAWESTFGEDVNVGIFDDSVDVEHEDLLGNYLGFGHDPANALESPRAPNPRLPFDAHGTAVLGLAVGDANDLGIRGVAPAARFTASRGLNDLLILSQIASVYTFARQRDVDVHINSWGFPFDSNLSVDVVVDAIRTSFLTGRDNRGMVIVFAAGNEAKELGPDDDLGTLPEVIGISASNANDRLASYSNFGADIDFAAPSGDAFLPGMVTTDTTDASGFASIGFNDGSGTDVFGQPDLSNPNYTQNFSGTSAACPVAAGVAALVLSRNLDLTAEQVRTIMAQTCEKIDPVDAAYHPITEHSLRYGYGRINAAAAVEAATTSADNDGVTWPEPIKSIEIRGNVLSWAVGDTIREIDHDNNEETPPIELGDKTFSILVVESTSPFTPIHAFIPTDEEPYPVGDEPETGIKVVQHENKTNFELPADGATRYYALFPRNSIGRYGFGVTIDTDGNIEGVSGGGGAGGGSVSLISFEKPEVSIDVLPLKGSSPLEVRFKGNALSNNPVDSVLWDFDDGETVDRSQATHLYEVPPGESHRFFPTFTVMDDQGNPGTRSVAIDVSGANTTTGPATDAEIFIVISLPGSVGSNVDRGTSPFSVQLNVAGTLANEVVEGVQWDLGDGGTAETMSVPHTYFNDTAVLQTLPISVEVTTRHASGLLVTQSATRFINIDPDPNLLSIEDIDITAGAEGDTSGDTGDVRGVPPPGVNPCGAGSSLALLSVLSLTLIRRRLR